MGKYTPGPWRVGTGEAITVWQDNGLVIPKYIAGCESGLNGIGLEERQANARLIATSPEALRILKDIIAIAPLGLCENFHHSSACRHDALEACPMSKRWEALLSEAEDVIRLAEETQHNDRLTKGQMSRLRDDVHTQTQEPEVSQGQLRESGPEREISGPVKGITGQATAVVREAEREARQ